MINNYQVILWFGVQLALGIGAAVGAQTSPATGFIAGLATLGAGWLTLQLGWSARKRKNALKPLSDGVAVLGLAAFLFLLFTQTLVWALGALLLAAQLAMNLILREYRQLYFGLVIAFVFVLAGAAEAVSGSYLLFIAYGLAVSFCFAQIWLDQRPDSVEDLPAPNFWQRFRVGALLLFVAALIYLLMPRPPAANLGSQESSSPDYYTSQQWEQEAGRGASGEDSGTGLNSDGSPQSRGEPGVRKTQPGYQYGGFDNQFDIRQPGGDTDQTGGEGSGEGNISRNSNGIVAYMRAAHGSYLKVRTFDRFDGTRWFSSTNRYRKRRVDFGHVTLRDRLEGNFRQVISINQRLSAFLPTAPQPVELWLPATVIAQDAWDQPLLPGPLQPDTRYTVDSHIEWFQSRLVSAAPRPREADLQLPEDLDPRIGQLARRVTTSATSDFRKAQALEHHLRTQYEYSFESIFESQGVTPLPKFLFEQNRGHCEYFASAMAIMLRTQGIPARLITGFSATQKNPMTGYYEIRALDGHAWVEAWIPDAGWITFEPTAFYQLPTDQTQTLSAQQINDYVENLRRAEEAVGDGEWTWRKLLASLWEALFTATIVALAYIKLFILTTLPLLVTLAVAAAALFATRDRWQPRLLRVLARWRIHHYRPADPRAAARFYLYQLQRMSRSHDIPRAPGEPIMDWSQRVTHRYPDARALLDLAEMVNRLYYQEQPVPLEQLQKASIQAASGLAG
ncbi:transglutaminaseTgpA domain-containing protein [Marinobacteraceae bacterium S3BR75-40.1]